MSSKYRAKKITTEDGTFDSKKEYKRWQQLNTLLGEGVITNLQRQVRYDLLPAQKGKERNERLVYYKADFVYDFDGQKVVEDVKGFKTPEYILKRKLMKYIHNIEIHEV